MKFDYVLAFEILPMLLRATVVSIWVTFAGFAFALIGGILLVSLRRARQRYVAAATKSIIEFVRSTPLLVQIFFLYFIMPEYGLSLSPLQTGVLAIGLHYSCFLSEVYRAALENIPIGQWDAATALNLTRWQTYRRIVFKQTVPLVIPPAGSILIYMFKDSPLLAAISVTELMHVASRIGAEKFQYLEPITICGLIFLALSLATAGVLRLVEHRIGRQWR